MGSMLHLVTPHVAFFPTQNSRKLLMGSGWGRDQNIFVILMGCWVEKVCNNIHDLCLVLALLHAY